jgi:hypothetical protein
VWPGWDDRLVAVYTQGGKIAVTMAMMLRYREFDDVESGAV